MNPHQDLLIRLAKLFVSRSQRLLSRGEGAHDLLSSCQGQPELDDVRKQTDSLPAIFLILDVQLGVVPECLSLLHDLHAGTVLQVECDRTPHEPIHKFSIERMIDQVEIVVFASL